MLPTPPPTYLPIHPELSQAASLKQTHLAEYVNVCPKAFKCFGAFVTLTMINQEEEDRDKGFRSFGVLVDLKSLK